MKITDYNILVFDCEIKNVIDNVNVKWTTPHLMGHAVTASYNTKTTDYKIYMDDNEAELIDDLNSADMITGFNIKGFDLGLLKANIQKQLKTDIVIYDMLEESRKAVGGSPFSKGLRLDNHLEAMFGKDGMKSGDGADAPMLWQTKQIGKLCSYVLRDVNREKALFEHIWEHGWVETATHGKQHVTRPQEVLQQQQFNLGF